MVILKTLYVVYCSDIPAEVLCYIDSHARLKQFLQLQVEHVQCEHSGHAGNLYKATAEKLLTLADNFNKKPNSRVEILWLISEDLPSIRKQYELYGALKRWILLLNCQLIIVYDTKACPENLNTWASVLSAPAISLNQLGQQQASLWSGSLHIYHQESNCFKVPNVFLHLSHSDQNCDVSADCENSCLWTANQHPGPFLEFVDLVPVVDVPEFYFSSNFFYISILGSENHPFPGEDVWDVLEKNPQLGFLARLPVAKSEPITVPVESLETNADIELFSDKKWYEELAAHAHKEDSFVDIRNSCTYKDHLSLLCFKETTINQPQRLVAVVLQSHKDLSESIRSYTKHLLEEVPGNTNGTLHHLQMYLPAYQQIRTGQKTVLTHCAKDWKLDVERIAHLPTSVLIDILSKCKHHVLTSLQKKNNLVAPTVTNGAEEAWAKVVMNERNRIQALCQGSSNSGTMRERKLLPGEIFELVNKSLNNFCWSTGDKTAGPSAYEKQIAALPWPECLEHLYFDVSYNKDNNSELSNNMINEMISSIKCMEHQSLVDGSQLEDSGMSLRNRNLPGTISHQSEKSRKTTTKLTFGNLDRRNLPRKRKHSETADTENYANGPEVPTRPNRSSKVLCPRNSKQAGSVFSHSAGQSSKEKLPPRNIKKKLEEVVHSVLRTNGLNSKSEKDLYVGCFRHLLDVTHSFIKELSDDEIAASEAENIAKSQFKTVLKFQMVTLQRSRKT